MPEHRSFLLESTPDQFCPRPFSVDDIVIVAATVDEVYRCRHLWLEVGRSYWTHRSRWADPRWRKHLNQPEVSFWIASRAGGDIGFFELTNRVRGVKMEGFGLLPQHRGQGLGGGLLSAATEKAFASGAKRIWLQQAPDDNPNALPNYLAGGYRIYRQGVLKNPLPSREVPG